MRESSVPKSLTGAGPPFYYIVDSKSIVSPGIACSDGDAPGGKDCMVAYVPQDFNDRRVRIASFDVIEGANYYELEMDWTYSDYPVNLYSTTDIALWYIFDKWWMVVKNLELTKFYSSEDGLQWQIERGHYQQNETKTPQGVSVVVNPSVPLAFIGFTQPDN